MADPQQDRPARPRAPRLIEIILLLSLTLNLFALGGYAYSRMIEPPRPVAASGAEQRLEPLARRLGIDPQTSKPFKDWRRALQAARDLLSQAIRPLMDDVWDALNQPTPDAAQIQALFDTMAAHRRAFQQDATASLTRFLASLTPEQRATFFAIVADRRDPLGKPVRAIGIK